MGRRDALLVMDGAVVAAARVMLMAWGLPRWALTDQFNLTENTRGNTVRSIASTLGTL